MIAPEIRKSELNAVRRLLTSVREEERQERLADALRAKATPLRTRVALARRSERATVGSGIQPCNGVAV